MKSINAILEGLNSKSIDEGAKFKPREGFGCTFSKDFGDIKAGTKLYCDSIKNGVVTLVMQKDRSQKIMLPLAFAEQALMNVSMLEQGKTYTLKIDVPYMQVEYAKDLDWSDGFIRKYTKKFKGEDWVVFPKGTKFKYTGDDKSGDEFLVDGENVEISDVSLIGDEIGKSINNFSEIFK